MTQYAYTPIFELTRGNTVETVHFGALAVVDAYGRLVASWGDPYTVTFLRSSAKPFQVLPFLECGGADYYHLSSSEIALMCASHNGSDEHIAVLRSLQEKTGVRESDLRCGVHPISHKPTLEAMQQRGEALDQNRNNCSGKHTGMLAFARMRGLSLSDYLELDHPIQQDILRTFAEMCDMSVEQVSMGIDGCSAPNFAVPLYNAALAFARLCDPVAGKVTPTARSRACQQVVSAMTAHPVMVAGADRFDTLLMQVAPGRLLCKSGAEGYLALGLLPGALYPDSPAMGIALKISDGDLSGHSRPAHDPLGRARPAVALEALRQLGALQPLELKALADFGPEFIIPNWRQLYVGLGRPCFKLRRSA